nr:hypothetical protein MFLOJ_42200 [Mycobacterium florentinum]
MKAVEDGWLYAAGDVNHRALLTHQGKYQGRNQRCLLGLTLVGPGATELLHAATIAVAGQVRIERLWHAVPCFPTISELWLKLLEAYRDSPVQSKTSTHGDLGRISS